MVLGYNALKHAHCTPILYDQGETPGRGCSRTEGSGLPCQRSRSDHTWKASALAKLMRIYQTVLISSWASSPVAGHISLLLREWNADQIVGGSVLDQKTVSCSIVVPVAWAPETSCASSLSFIWISLTRKSMTTSSRYLDDKCDSRIQTNTFRRCRWQAGQQSRLWWTKPSCPSTCLARTLAARFRSFFDHLSWMINDQRYDYLSTLSEIPFSNF